MGKEKFFSRRDFLKATGAFAVASALGLPLLSCEEDQGFLDVSSITSAPKDNNPPPTETPRIFTPENYISLRFLSNPFRNDPKMAIQQGWFYTWLDENKNPAKHNGIDFIKGEIDNSKTWEPFDVLSAADGWVCVDPPLRLGNAVFMTHLVNGMTFYTYYGHLEKIENGIPKYAAKKEFLGGVPVRRGEKIGVAGASGVTNEKGEPEPTWIHLHFGAQDADGPMDPYDLHGERNMYPNPNSTNPKNLGPHSLWR